MILQNLFRRTEYPVRTTGIFDSRSNWGIQNINALNRFVSEASLSSKAAIPYGYTPGYSPWPARVSGGLSAYKTIDGDTAIHGNLAGGRNAEATIPGVGTISRGEGSLVVQLIAALAGIGEFESDPVISGKLEAAATLAGTGDITSALGAIAGLIADLNGTGEITDALPEGYGSMSASIYVNQSEAEVTQIVSGVWNALVAEYDESGSMGEAMGAAGTAGDPWTTELPGAYSGDQAGNIIGKKLLTTGKFLGLK